MQIRDLSGAPAAPIGFGLDDQYDSYTTDPLFARRFTYAWTTVAAIFVLFNIPRLYSLRRARFWQGWALYETLDHGYQAVDDWKAEDKADLLPPKDRHLSARRGRHWLVLSTLKGSAAFLHLRTLKWLNLDFGQVLVLSGYLATLLVCITYQAHLLSNSNRAGFLTLAQLPFVFLFAAKSSPLTLLLGKGYEKLNFLHRWAGRALLVSATIHGALWIRFDIVHNQQNLLLTGGKERLGQATYALLCLIVLASLPPVRRYAYNFFFYFHNLVTIAFFITACYHTPYAIPWVIPPIAFYTFDGFARLVRLRFKDAYLDAPDTQITIVRIPDVSGGWVAGQHVRVRMFFDGRMFESHPLSICNAPPSITNFSDTPSSMHQGGMMLAAKNCGDWSGALNTLARSELPEDKVFLRSSSGDVVAGIERCVGIMIDGPYGGSSVDFSTCENVLMVAGGSGITFTLGLLDDLVGRIVIERSKSKIQQVTKTRRITFAWCMKSYGAINWFSNEFQALAKAASEPSLDLVLEFRFFVTCCCNPSSLPTIRNCEIVQTKPAISKMLGDFVSDCSHGTGGLGIAASGPPRLTSDTKSAVASLGPFAARRFGGIQLHTEAYSL